MRLVGTGVLERKVPLCARGQGVSSVLFLFNTGNDFFLLSILEVREYLKGWIADVGEYCCREGSLISDNIEGKKLG